MEMCASHLVNNNGVNNTQTNVSYSSLVEFIYVRVLVHVNISIFSPSVINFSNFIGIFGEKNYAWKK